MKLFLKNPFPERHFVIKSDGLNLLFGLLLISSVYCGANDLGICRKAKIN
jgi:hypothetical protein